MAAPPALARVRIEEEGDLFLIHIEDRSGGALTLSARRDDLEMLADTLDDLLIGED